MKYETYNDLVFIIKFLIVVVLVIVGLIIYSEIKEESVLMKNSCKIDCKEVNMTFLNYNSANGFKNEECWCKDNNKVGVRIR